MANAHPGKAPFHPTRILVKLKEGERAIAEQPVLREHGLKVRRQFKGLARTAVLDLADDAEAKALAPAARTQRLKDRIAALRDTGRFEYVEPDFIRNQSAVPSDTAFADGTLWALRNTGQNSGLTGADIGAVAAWDITTGSNDVIVAVVDSGIRYTHQDLAANMWHNPGESGGGKETNGIDDDGDGYVDNVYGINAVTGSGDPMDDFIHGSFVAGIIGAAANDAGPHVGVAWKVSLMACKFLDSSGGGYTSDGVECLEFALAKGARVINASYSGDYFSQAEYEAIKSLRDHGVLFVTSSGNDGRNTDAFPSYPSSIDLHNVIAVAATDRTDNLESSSNYGAASVHLGAPGVDIFSCDITSDSAYATYTGTSLAAPHVAGAAALILAKYPAATETELRRRILNGAVPLASLTNKTVTGGRLNVLNSLTATPTGNLEIEVSPRAGSPLAAGKTVSLYAVVTDLLPVTHATVTASSAAFTDLTLLDGGVAPDAIAADGVFTASFSVPANGTSLDVTLQVAAPGRQSVTQIIHYAVVTHPPNDDFANRITIPSSNDPQIVTGSNFNATRETGEPDHLGYPFGASSWWSWTAPFTGPAKISTIGSGFDTLLAVYTGATVSNLTLVAANNDDDASWFDLYSCARFNAIAGTQYQLAVDGYAAQEGGIVLSVLSLTSTVTLPEALDQPALVVTSTGLDPWLGQTVTTHDGTDAARSGPIVANGQSVMETTITGPGMLTFWCKVSSETSYDILSFSINGEEKAALSGEVAWQQQTYWLGTETNTLRWTYSKDYIGSAGQDIAWVDEIAFTPFAPAIPYGFGDLDRDGKPTVLDLALLTGYLHDSNSLPPEIATFADVNGDGLVNHNDTPALADAILGRTVLRPVLDSDGDGIPDPLETLLGFDPTKGDSNNDDIPDGDEDSDHDGLTNAQEIKMGLNPTRLDSDGDGWSDEAELSVGSIPLDPESRPYMMVVAAPAVSLVLPANEGTGGLPLNTVVANPPVSLLLPGNLGAEGLLPNTTVAAPPVSLVLPANEGAGGHSPNTTVANPPVTIKIGTP
jgi:subtilisin family serine protease